MTVRTTVAFHPATAARLEWRAKRWGVSKSEAMRSPMRASRRLANVATPRLRKTQAATDHDSPRCQPSNRARQQGRRPPSGGGHGDHRGWPIWMPIRRMDGIPLKTRNAPPSIR